jgi:hypothetical protein
MGLGGPVSEKEYWDGDDGGETGTEGGGRGGTGLFIKPCVGVLIGNGTTPEPTVFFEDALEYDSPPLLFPFEAF